MVLQKQLAVVGQPGDFETAAFNSRLLRVVTKLFVRVIKVEECVSSPFSAKTIDMESLLCAMDDQLSFCEASFSTARHSEQDNLNSCIEMVKTLVMSILKWTKDVDGLFALLSELELKDTTSLLGKMFAACNSPNGSVEIEVEVQQQPEANRSHKGEIVDDGSRSSQNEVTRLVSAFARAQGEGRAEAMEALRAYTGLHGDQELKDHLQQLSAPFRLYLEQQLGDDDHPAHAAAVGDGSAGHIGEAMSERLRRFRTRLRAAEAVDSSALNTHLEGAGGDSDSSQVDMGSTESPLGVAAPMLTQRSEGIRQSRLSAPSPSKFNQPTPPKSMLPPSRLSQPSPAKFGVEGGAGSSSQTLRERLAAAQEKRSDHPPVSAAGSSPTAKRATSTTSGLSSPTASSGTAHTYGRAASLRARLEAVRQQNGQ
jgi:hypothetical protein